MRDGIDALEFVMHLETAIGRAVLSARPLSWSEDHITYSVLQALRDSVEGTRVQGDWRHYLRIAAQAYKLTGTPERLYGDIAILVRLTTYEQGIWEGVGFLEAKKRGLHDGQYDAFKLSQVERLARSAPHAGLLMYDVDGVGMTKGLPEPGGYRLGSSSRSESLLTFHTRALCVPLSLVVQAKRCDTSLYRFGTPMSVQCVHRFFAGFDLHFEDTVLRDIKGFGANLQGGAPFLLAVGIVEGGQRIEIAAPAVSADAYVRL